MVSAPDWLTTFSQRVAALVLPYEDLSPMGCHVHEADGTWEVTVFQSATEIYGGRRDGRRTTSRFAVDLLALPSLFDSVASIHWQAQSLGSEDDLGPHIAVEGVHQGHKVWLRIPAHAPSVFPPGRIHHHARQACEEVW